MAADSRKLSRKDYADYEFVVRESERLLAMGIEARMEYYRDHREDVLSALWGKGGGSLECTRQGTQRFAQIVARGLEALGRNALKHSATTLTSALKAKFVDNALEICAATTEENAHDIFTSVVHEVEQGYKELTHYIPCSFAAHKEPVSLAIGPVQFVPRETFMQENDAALRDGREAESSSAWRYEELKRFFSVFDWVACVRVPPCDRSVSEQRSREVTQRALDLFKLIVGGEGARRVGQGHSLMAPNVLANLTSSDTDDFSISWSRQVPGAIVPDGWYRQVSEFKPWRTAESIISDHWKNWANIPEPQQRFLDALSWHGDGLCDPDTQAATLKFWTAIERVVSFREGDPVTRRAALLSVSDASQFSTRFKQCQSLYTHRSRILHGNECCKTPKSSGIVIQMEELSKKILMFYLSMVAELQAKGTLTRHAMQDVFTKYEELSRKAEGPAVERVHRR